MRPFTGLTQGFGVLKGMTPLIGTLGLALLLGGLARPGRNGNGIAPAAGDYAAFAPSPQSTYKMGSMNGGPFTTGAIEGGGGGGQISSTINNLYSTDTSGDDSTPSTPISTAPAAGDYAAFAPSPQSTFAPAAGDYAAFAPSPQSNAAYQAIYQESVAMHTSIGDYAVTETVQTANTTPVVQTASASVVNAANANGSATQEVPGYAF